MTMMKTFGDLSRSFRNRPSQQNQSTVRLDDHRGEVPVEPAPDKPEWEEPAPDEPAPEEPRHDTAHGLQTAPALDADTHAEEGEPRCKGFIDRIDATHIHGWAYDNVYPGAPVTIQVLLPDGRESLVQADLFRGDLKEAGYGDGCHGFQIKYEDCKAGGSDVRILFYETKQVLVGGVVALDPRKLLLQSTMPAAYRQTMMALATQARAAYTASRTPTVRT